MDSARTQRSCTPVGLEIQERLLSPAECNLLGVPHGSKWRSKASHDSTRPAQSASGALPTQNAEPDDRLSPICSRPVDNTVTPKQHHPQVLATRVVLPAEQTAAVLAESTSPAERSVSTQCYACGQTGHSATYCPLVTCSFCGQHGHSVRGCLQRQAMNTKFVQTPRDPSWQWELPRTPLDDHLKETYDGVGKAVTGATGWVNEVFTAVWSAPTMAASGMNSGVQGLPLPGHKADARRAVVYAGSLQEATSPTCFASTRTGMSMSCV
jgi:hypothetical protein